MLCWQEVLCALEVVKINTFGVCFAKGSVFLEGFKVTGGMWIVIWFDYLVDYPIVFWGLDVALHLRLNRYKYKLLVYFSLTFCEEQVK